MEGQPQPKPQTNVFARKQEMILHPEALLVTWDLLKLSARISESN